MRSLFAGTVLLTLATGGCSLIEDATTVPIDYDVGLIEPVEFDGSEALEPTAVDVEVSTATPTATLNIDDAGQWGPLLEANAALEELGEPRIFSIRSSSPPTFTGDAPVRFAITVSSANGVVVATDLAAEAQPVASCTFVLDPATAAADDFGLALETCIVDWAAENGIPQQLALSVATSSTVSAAGGDPSYLFQSGHTMSTNQQVETGCETDIALPSDVIERLEDLTFDQIGLFALANANANVYTVWTGSIFDGTGRRRAYGVGADQLGPGIFITYDASVEHAGEPATVTTNANVTLSPADPSAFLDAAILALSGDGGTPGSGVACWFSIGDAPRSGTLSVTLSGVARLGL